MERNCILCGQKKMLVAHKWTFQIQRGPHGHQNGGFAKHRIAIQGIILCATHL